MYNRLLLFIRLILIGKTIIIANMQIVHDFRHFLVFRTRHRRLNFAFHIGRKKKMPVRTCEIVTICRTQIPRKKTDCVQVDHFHLCSSIGNCLWPERKWKAPVMNNTVQVAKWPPNIVKSKNKVTLIDIHHKFTMRIISVHIEFVLFIQILFPHQWKYCNTNIHTRAHTFTYACAEVKIPHKHRSRIILFFSLIIFDYNTIKCQSFISQTDQSKWFAYERQASIVRINREIHTNMSESLLNIVISLICIKATTKEWWKHSKITLMICFDSNRLKWLRLHFN